MDKTRPQMLTVAEKRKKKSGNKPKDSVIADNFNMDKRGVVGQNEAVTGQNKGGRPPGRLTQEQKDERASRQLLDDMRYAYRNAKGKGGKKGRARMLELFETDADFKFAVKEMLKLESSMQSARIKRDPVGGGGGRVTTFVILKGLQTEDEVMGTGVQSKTLDLQQIANAYNPSAQPKIDRPEEEISRPEGG